MFFNAFIRLVFSYCSMFWFSHNHYGMHKLVDKIDYVITYLARKRGINYQEFMTTNGLLNITNVYTLQCLTFTYNLMHNSLKLPSFLKVCNNMLYD